MRLHAALPRSRPRTRGGLLAGRALVLLGLGLPGAGQAFFPTPREQCCLEIAQGADPAHVPPCGSWRPTGPECEAVVEGWKRAQAGAFTDPGDPGLPGGRPPEARPAGPAGELPPSHPAPGREAGPGRRWRGSVLTVATILAGIAIGWLLRRWRRGRADRAPAREAPSGFPVGLALVAAMLSVLNGGIARFLYPFFKDGVRPGMREGLALIFFWGVELLWIPTLAGALLLSWLVRRSPGSRLAAPVGAFLLLVNLVLAFVALRIVPRSL